MTAPRTGRQSQPPKPWFREPFVWLIILIPGSAVLMGVVMITLAIVSYDGLVADDYYKRGLEINRSLARDAAAARYGLSASIQIEPQANTVSTLLSARKSFQLPPNLQLELHHATRAGFDRTLTLVRSAGGSYSSDIPNLVPGHWYLSLHADDWRLTGAIEFPNTRDVQLNANETGS